MTHLLEKKVKANYLRCYSPLDLFQAFFSLETTQIDIFLFLFDKFFIIFFFRLVTFVEVYLGASQISTMDHLVKTIKIFCDGAL